MKHLKTLYGGLAAACLAAVMCSCMREDLSGCPPEGQSLRYVYNLNMSGGDAFAAQVGSVSLYVFDSEDNLVGQYTDGGAALRHESYRMKLDLAPGTYRFAAWCGMDSPTPSFALNSFTGRTGMLNSLRTVDGASDSNLSPLWFGEIAEVLIGESYSEHTIYLTKDTKNIRVVLQQMDGQKTDASLFGFTITDRNSVLDCDNVPSGEVTYKPFTVGQSDVGGGDGQSVVTVAYAEFSTSRLFTGNTPLLTITRLDDGITVLSLPLLDYLTMRSANYASWSDQEYLDRESDYTLVFFLDRDYEWISSTIIVNGWMVRLNDLAD